MKPVPLALVASVVVAAALSACTPATPVLYPEVQRGAAAGTRPARTLVLHAACGSVEARCPGTYIDTVDQVVRGGLELAGFNLVLVVLDGPGFTDLSLDERRGILAQTGADAVLSVRIVVGGRVGVWTTNQSVEVMVKLGVDQGDVMAWASRCTATSNDFSTVEAALEHAARCAIHGGTQN